MNDLADAKAERIRKLKEEKNALILAHYYQSLEIQRLADICGDSFELAKQARASDKEIIIFCGVRFMAESAKIMNPEKRVFIPRPDSGCLMADMLTCEKLSEMKNEHPDAEVVCYINSSAKVKEMSDICVTSSNAEKIISKLCSREIIFVPDMHLGQYTARKFPEKKFYFMDGYCPVHHAITPDDLRKAKRKHPGALVAVHPECPAEVAEKCDFVGSTSGILDFCRKSSADEFIISTERAIVERLSEECPDKKFHLISDRLVCADMKKTTPDDLERTLDTLSGEIIMTKEEMDAARLPLERMLEYAAKA